MIGIPARPIAPQTQSAHWKPPVNAAGAAEPAAVSVLKWPAATVDAIATPIAPPICCVVLSRPEARPASCSATPASPAIEIGMNAKAVPAPATKNGPARLLQKWPSTGTAVAQRIPPPIIAIPAASTNLAEKRVTSACESPARATEVIDAASQARPVWIAE